MGTRFVELFQDAVFSASIRKSAVNLFVSCLGDLTIFAVAHAAEQARARGAGTLDAETAASVAEACFRTALAAGIEDKDRDLVPEDAVDAFKARLAATHWANAGVDDGDFQRSCEDLVRFAPVIDEFKELDREIVLNSMRFRWVDIRKQLRNRLDGVALVTMWLGLDNRNA